MLNDRYLSRPKWERKLRSIGAEPLPGKGRLNTAEWWCIPGKYPFTVPIEEPGDRAEFWAIQKLVDQLRDR